MLDTASRHHIARVVLIYREENFESAIQAMETALGLDLGAIIPLPTMGLRMVASLAAGIEIVSPLGYWGLSIMLRHWLEERGEGFLGMVMRVPSLASAITQAEAAGYPPIGEPIDCLAANPEWERGFRRLLEQSIAPVAGVCFTLIEGAEQVGLANRAAYCRSGGAAQARLSALYAHS